MKLTYSFLLFLICFITQAQNEFITTWEVSSNDLSITIPTDDFNFTYDYTVDFGDGTILNNQTDDASHTYGSAGIYIVTISGTFPKFDGGASSDHDKLLTIEQWGNIQWQSMANAFSGFSILTINATDTPDLSNVTDMSFMFQGADSVNSPIISTWDVSNVSNMEGLFKDSFGFNQSLNNWDVSNVTNMESMFSESHDFNQPLNNWDTGNVTNMKEMFRSIAVSPNNFNQPIDNWDVSSVVNMSAMFYQRSDFDQPIGSWDVSNVEDMSYMFFNNDTFNQSLDNWDVSNVTDMESMFEKSSYNQPLNSWNPTNVTNMWKMFRESNFNQPIGNWNTSSVTITKEMFEESSYNQPLNNWDVSNVTNMEEMFDQSNFNQSINSWDVSSVTNMRFMFSFTDSFDQPLENWNVSNVSSMEGMFKESSFNQPLNNWNTENVQDFEEMFYNSNFNQNINDWNVSSASGNAFQGMFENSDFNQNISSWTFNTNDFDNFIKNSAMNSQNYDLLLGRFVQLDINFGNLDADGLEYCDIFTREKLIDDLGWNISNDEIADDCNSNFISGNIRFDEDNDGCSPNDVVLGQFVVNINDGQNDVSVMSDNQGDYFIPVDQGNFDVAMLNLPDYLNASPSTYTLNFNNTDVFEDQKDFCITANQSVEDLSIELFPIDDARPGFESDYELIIENNGTQTVQNAQATVNFEGAKQDFVSANQTPSSITSNSITFTISNLLPFNSEVVSFKLFNFQPPDLEGGDVLNFDAGVSPNANDINPDDNTVNFDQTVVNSFDPNDKLVTQGEQIPDEKIDEYLDYKIRFQNVGTANAINVTITDTISNKLDWTTFQPINSSHDYRLELVNQKEINFIFENINLPYEAIDEPGSNGHVSFKIKPKDDVQIGDIIENKAYIFFDFNAPIITNTVSTEIVDNLSTTGFVLAENIKLSPNPADDQVEIINESNATIQRLQLYSIKGQLINTFTNKSLIDISSLSSGVYILQVETENNKINKRLIMR